MTTDVRGLDLALFGATGFTGGVTADYLAAHAPAGLRWAVVGRDPAKLAAVRDRLGGAVETRVADADDPAALRRVAEEAAVVVSTVGPYLRYGEPLVAACAAAGTDYVDVTGEPEFVDRIYVQHHAIAERTGARLVHACGLDSVPHDLGALFTVQQLPAGRPIRLRGVLRGSARPSGGTFETTLTSLARGPQLVAARRARRAVERQPHDRRVRWVPGRPGYDRAVGAWVVPFPSLDPLVVTRSARALPAYGPDFTYSHFVGFGNPLALAGAAAGLSGLAVLAQLPPARRALRRLRPPGSGPSPETRAHGWFEVRFVAEVDGRRVVTAVRGGDPVADETAKMLAEAALCLRYDDLPETAGQVTTAVAMGDALRDRLERAGVGFVVLDGAQPSL